MKKRIGSIAILFFLLCSCSGQNIDINSTEIDIEAFVEIKQVVIEADLQTDKKPNDVDAPYHVTGIYDMNKDGTNDNIKVTLCRRVNGKNSSIQINENSLEIKLDNPYDVYIIDLDKNDTYTELAILDDGSSGDPNMKFFRYYASEIVFLGTVRDSVLVDSCGKVISTWEIVNFEPKIILGVHEIQKNKLVYKSIDFSKSLNMEYTFPSDSNAYFKEIDKVTDDFIPSYNDKVIQINKGEILIIKKVNIQNNHPYWYYVEISGKKGVLYFVDGD